MSQIYKSYFYYGAILNMILQHNPDASTTLISNEENSRQIYKILTGTSRQECVLFLKYSSTNKQVTNEKYSSWTFSFTDTDKEKINQYVNEPVFIYLLGIHKNIADSKIIILTYEDYLKVSDRQSITIGFESGNRSFYLFNGFSKSKKDAYLIPTNRIYKSFDELTVPVPKKPIKKINIYELVNKKVVHHSNSTICPFCNRMLEEIEISHKSLSLSAKKCLKCERIYVSSKSYNQISKIIPPRNITNSLLVME